MANYVYLSLIPEGLIASMLPPEEFGSYFATGSHKRSHGQALFFEVDVDQISRSDFPLDLIGERCHPHPDGHPKRSVYLSVYRVLERVPRSALTAMYLTTDDGRVLRVEPRPFEPHPEEQLHLYQEFCPFTPRVASRLSPVHFAKLITNPELPVHAPRLVFCDLVLGDLHRDPDSERVDDLPYANIGHLRDCLRELRNKPDKKTKTVNRQLTREVLFRTIRHAYFVGDQEGITAFPLPSKDRLEREYYAWWRSAQATFVHH
jgi:hypothetical protein